MTKIDSDTFKLSEINIQENGEQKDHFYNIKQYVDFNTCGIGTHIFNYQDISVEVIGKVGISPVNGDNFNAKIEPIFRGEITSLHLSNGGVGYGSSEVINFERPPEIRLNSGYGAQLKPVVSNGKISQVIILNSGRKYTNSPDLNIIGNGIGAVLVPIIENESISRIEIISGGFGYDDQTDIDVGTFRSRCKIQTKFTVLENKFI